MDRSNYISQPYSNEGDSDIRSFATANKISYYTGEPLAQRTFRIDDYYQIPGTIGNENFGNTQLEGGDGNKKTYKKNVEDEIPSSIVDDTKDSHTNHTVGGSLDSFPAESNSRKSSASYRLNTNGPIISKDEPQKPTEKDADELKSKEFRRENPEPHFESQSEEYYFSSRDQVNKPTTSAGLSGDTSSENVGYRLTGKYDKDLSSQIVGGGGRHAQPLGEHMDITNQRFYAESTGDVKRTDKLGYAKSGGQAAPENINNENIKLA